MSIFIQNLTNLIVPTPNFKDRPRKAVEILGWSKETCGTIFYIKREVYLISGIIELLKLSGIALKYYINVYL